MKFIFDFSKNTKNKKLSKKTKKFCKILQKKNENKKDKSEDLQIRSVKISKTIFENNFQHLLKHKI